MVPNHAGWQIVGVSCAGCLDIFEQFRRSEYWHLGELKMASRRTHSKIITHFFPTRSQEKYKFRELIKRIHVKRTH